MTTFAYPFDTATPDGATQAVSTLDDRIREAKQAEQERNNVDHYWPLTGTQVSDSDAGKHRKVTFYGVLSAKPTLDTGEGALYIKTISGKSELFFEDSDGTEIQLTTGGKFNLTASNVPDDSIDDGMILLANAAPLMAADAAGTGEVELIAAGRNEADDADVCVLPDETRLDSDAAPTEDSQVANKKYVDDQIDASLTPLGALQTTDSLGNALAVTNVYKAPCDGTVTWYGRINAATYLLGQVGATSPPSTTVSRHDNATLSDAWFSQSFEVATDEYWKITSGGVAGLVIYWRPRGTGACVKQ